MLFIILSVLLLIGFIVIYNKFKFPKVSSLCLVTGGVKCGKSTFSTALAIREHKKAVRKTKIKNFFLKLFNKPQKEIPLLYSNVPLTVPYSPVTEDLLLRKTRFVYGSIILIQESSLCADSQLIKDKDVNTQLLLYNKLIGHETRGGKIIYDTQSVSDNHYSIKRCLSEYFYIHHLTKWIPFFLIAHVQETRYSDDGTIVVTENQDIEEKLKMVLIPKSTWKKFDCYCYSILTDNLPVSRDMRIGKKGKLKANQIVSFRKEIINGGMSDEKKDNI